MIISNKKVDQLPVIRRIGHNWNEASCRPFSTSFFASGAMPFVTITSVFVREHVNIWLKRSLIIDVVRLFDFKLWLWIAVWKANVTSCAATCLHISPTVFTCLLCFSMPHSLCFHMVQNNLTALLAQYKMVHYKVCFPHFHLVLWWKVVYFLFCS